YQLTVSGVQDINGNTIAAPGTLQFQCGNDTTPPSLLSVTVVSATAGSTVLMLNFSEAVDNVTGNVMANYTGDYKNNTGGDLAGILSNWGGSTANASNLITAGRQGNTAQVKLTFQPALPNGGHQIGVKNVTDLVSNVILSNSVNNVQPVIVNAPTGFVGGPVFDDPFGDGTAAGLITVYDGKIYLGTDKNSSKLFEMNYGLTQAQTITLDADGTFGAPYENFEGYVSRFSGCTGSFSNPPISADGCNANQVQGVDAIYSACVGGTSIPQLTGTACTSISGAHEYMFIASRRTNSIGSARYRSFWYTETKSSSSTVFPFTEGFNGDTNGGTYSYRAMNVIVFKDYLFVNMGTEQGGGGRGGRVCVNPAGCAGGYAYLSYVQLPNTSSLTRIGAQSNTSGGNRKNGSFNSNDGGNYRGPGEAGDTDTGILNAITAMYEYDNDGTGGNESQLYLANGGFYNGALTAARVTTTDGGIVRTKLTYSSKSSLPLDCATGGNGCTNYYEDVTPDAKPEWYKYLSIPLPQNSSAVSASNCATGYVEMECTLPYNLFVPALKAIPYMRTAPNGDLYLARNACDTNNLNRNGKNGAGGADFRTERQVCPKGHEVPQLWMLPKGTTASPKGAADWVLVAQYGTSGKTNMNGQNAIGAHNSHISLLEFVGSHLYVGWDNGTDGANVWRTDMTSVASGSTPAESSFSMVNLPGIESGGGGSNQKIFSHVTVNDGGKDWLILTTRDGSNAMKIYRTANGQN
ncbi:MAG TPA: hypothetical protein PLY93_10380, partial [Turneriella sp.]|nr:hypothetical protein [Turneriella sp.]